MKFPVIYLDGMGVDEFGPHVEVCHSHSLELNVVTPVDTSNVRLHIVNHLVPVVIDLFREVPAAFPLVFLDFAQFACKMHQFLGNASHIDTRSSNAPLCALSCRVYVVTESDFASRINLLALFGTCKSS